MIQPRKAYNALMFPKYSMVDEPEEEEYEEDEEEGGVRYEDEEEEEEEDDEEEGRVGALEIKAQ